MGFHKAFAIQCLVMYFSIVCLGQIDSRSGGLFSPNDVELTISPTAIKSTDGAPISLDLSLKNHWQNAVSLYFERQDFLAGYEITIIDSRGKSVAKAAISTPAGGYGSWSEWVIHAGSEDKRSLLLSQYFALKPGRYSVTV